VLKCVATAADSGESDPRFGPYGAQRCEDTGPLTIERMKTVDGEFLEASLDFMERANQAGEPFFV
jgi:arylsulfatase